MRRDDHRCSLGGASAAWLPRSIQTARLYPRARRETNAAGDKSGSSTVHRQRRQTIVKLARLIAERIEDGEMIGIGNFQAGGADPCLAPGFGNDPVLPAE